MRRQLLRIGSALTAALLCWGAPAWAQQYTISHTTLNAAVGINDTTVTLASASASAGSSFGAPSVGQCLVVEGEAMRITAVSSTTMTVQRGAIPGGGTNTPHASAAVVWTAPCNAFKSVDPPQARAAGNQSCTSQPAPWINLTNGNVWWCNTANNKWTGTNFAVFTYNSVPTAQ